MNRWRVGEDRGSKETDGCPLTTVGIVQTFAKQHPETSPRADVRMMDGVETDEAPIGGKEEVRIGAHKTGKSIKSGTVYSDEDGGGKSTILGRIPPSAHCGILT
jgi:hypothetical protein